MDAAMMEAQMRILGILVGMMQCAFQLMSDGLVGMREMAMHRVAVHHRGMPRAQTTWPHVPFGGMDADGAQLGWTAMRAWRVTVGFAIGPRAAACRAGHQWCMVWTWHGAPHPGCNATMPTARTRSWSDS